MSIFADENKELLMGFVKISDRILVKSSLVFVLVWGGRLAAPFSYVKNTKSDEKTNEEI